MSESVVEKLKREAREREPEIKVEVIRRNQVEREKAE